jgi:hypothetical protein
MCIPLSTWIATPIESSAKIDQRRHNTITQLFDKQNIMLIIQFATSGSVAADALSAIESSKGWSLIPSGGQVASSQPASHCSD